MCLCGGKSFSGLSQTRVTLTFMAQKTPNRSFVNRLQLRLATARFFSFSLLVHVILVVLGGSIVLYKAQVEAPDFVAGEGSILTDQNTVAMPPEAQPEHKEMTTPEAVTPQIAAAPISAITSVTATASQFEMSNIAATVPVKGVQMASIDKGLADKMAALGSGAGMKGGSTRMLGQREKLASAFVGTFYDLKQTRNKKPTNITPDEYHKVFRKYIAENWKESIFAEYFRAKDPVYATQIFTPNIPAVDGPKSFNLEKEVQPSRWLVHYRARVSPPEDGTYHFVGAGDDVMLVRFDGKLVLDRCWYQADEQLHPERNYEYGWSNIPNGFGKGKAVRAQAGKYYDMDVLIGEQPGGLSYAALLVEQEGVEYPQDSKGNPILPVFRFVDAPLADPEPGQTYAPHMENGPVWKAITVDPNGGDSTFDQFFGKKN